jgi:hypothetical protein
MKSEELKRLKAGALAVMLSMSLTACASSHGFNFTSTRNRNLTVSRNSVVNNEFIGKCYVAEVYNKLKEENELYIVTATALENCKGYNDVLTPYSVMFSDNNDLNEFVVFKKVIPLIDYINALGLTKHSYSYADMNNLLDTIKSVHEFEDNLELTK